MLPRATTEGGHYADENEKVEHLYNSKCRAVFLSYGCTNGGAESIMLPTRCE